MDVIERILWNEDLVLCHDHWNNSSRIDTRTHSNSESLLVLPNVAYLPKKQQIPILQFVVWPTIYYRTRCENANQHITDRFIDIWNVKRIGTEMMCCCFIGVWMVCNWYKQTVPSYSLTWKSLLEWLVDLLKAVHVIYIKIIVHRKCLVYPPLFITIIQSTCKAYNMYATPTKDLSDLPRLKRW